jgi:hypothetical protein
MGEKPLSIDESPALARTIGGAAPPGGSDTPPPDMSGAAGIITTRSNIKGSHSVAEAGSGSGATDSDRRSDPNGIAIKEAPPGAAAGALKPTPTNPDDPFPAEGGAAGIAIKEQGVKYGEGGADATPAEDGPGIAGASEPIPGVDIIVKKHPPR